MTTAASVKVAREKLLELLREAKDDALATFDQRVQQYEEELSARRSEVVAAAKRDLKQEVNLMELSTAVGNYNRYSRDKRYDGTIGDETRKRTGERYDTAIKLVEISSDDHFKVTSNTEFGYLLGL